jgi:hypothetical protein
VAANFAAEELEALPNAPVVLLLRGHGDSPADACRWRMAHLAP